MPVFSTVEESEKQYKRLRRDVGASESVLSDELAEEYFLEAQELYPNDTSKMIAQARVVALKGIRASSALLGRYAQNQSEEDLTKVFGNLTTMLNDALAEVEDVADLVTPAVRLPFFEVARGNRGI